MAQGTRCLHAIRNYMRKVTSALCRRISKNNYACLIVHEYKSRKVLILSLEYKLATYNAGVKISFLAKENKLLNKT